MMRRWGRFGGEAGRGRGGEVVGEYGGEDNKGVMHGQGRI